ncbi:UPF0547 protein C16orf87-like [Sitodiplosis mosellana]|uniref:UPF0547 protein C16orf87-like n=1 Tax=Sitodiplosis mosellana TaxID=263140 RepID=UPI002444E76E|nr:UPF0547 protein C16orf87-like [Sitodiplosis mosellana]
MVKSRAIVKNCPKCDARVAVATKACKCGYSFFSTRRSERIREAVEEVDERRRTSRVRREKPNYYDSQQFEKKKKKKETKTKRKASSPERQTINDDHSKDAPAIRPKRKRVRKEEESEGIDLCAKLTPERQQLATLILSELNRKMCSVVWTP